MAIPKIIKNFNLLVDGQGFAGLCDEVTLPDLAINAIEHRAGGMDAPVSLDMGMELMELSFMLAEHSPVVFRQFGLINQNAVQCTFRAAQANDTEVVPYVIHTRGMYVNNNLGTIQNTDKAPLEATMHLRYFRMILDGEDLIEIDVDNMIRVVNGVDQLEAQRAALNI